MLTSKQFLAGFVMLAVASLISMVALSVRSDPYAMFRALSGPQAPIYTNERLSKHLLCYRYIPQHFDSMLIGPSVSGNFRTDKLPALSVYNASLDGSNLNELKVLVDLVQARRPLKYLLITLHPVLLRSHEPKTQFLQPRQYWISYGSLDLLKAVWTRFRVGSGPNQFDAWGRSDFNRFSPRKTPVETVISHSLKSESRVRRNENWQCDPLALAALGDILKNCKEHGTEVVILYPPMPWRLLQQSQARRQKFLQQLSPYLKGLRVIDFNQTDLTEESCFVDAEHLKDSAADRLIEIVGDQLAQTAKP